MIKISTVFKIINVLLNIFNNHAEVCRYVVALIISTDPFTFSIHCARTVLFFTDGIKMIKCLKSLGTLTRISVSTLGIIIATYSRVFALLLPHVCFVQ
jgi:hypothetical protein